MLVSSLRIFALFIVSAKVQLSASIPTDQSCSVPGQRAWLAHNSAHTLRLLSPCLTTRSLRLMQRAVVSCPCPSRNPVKGKESIVSSKTNALISQFANMLRCEWLTVRQEEQLSRRHSPHRLPCGQGRSPYARDVTSPAPDG